MNIFKFIKNSRGAMFGLDARIALYVFGGISTISAGYVITNMQEFYAQGFSKEIRDMAIAVERVHKDLKEDLHNSLDTETDENAVIALYDNTELASNALRQKWHGPYIIHESTTHRKYGNIRLTKAQDDASTACNTSTRCYLWLTYSAMRSNMTTPLNKIFDGESETTPASSGILQWTGSGDTVLVSYRISRALEI
jgi:hypothetical protein